MMIAAALAVTAPEPPSPEGGPAAIVLPAIAAELEMAGISALAAKPDWHGPQIAAVYYAIPGVGFPLLDLGLNDRPHARSHAPAFVYGASLLALAAANLLLPAHTSSSARFWMNFGGQNAAITLTITTAVVCVGGDAR